MWLLIIRSALAATTPALLPAGSSAKVNCLALIETKRDGQALSEQQISSVVSAYARGEIPDYQMAALLMAILLRGMDATETRALTMALRDSGQRLEFPSDPRPLVDKHSTGGVGDK